MTDTTPIPPLSDGTKTAVANLVDYTIEREYGHDVDAAIRGARTVALSGLQFDLRDQFIGINGHDNGLDRYAEATLRILARDGLEVRRCQCHTINGTCQHGTGASCGSHYEADVPPIDGALLCGTCHIAEYQARS